MPASSLTLSAVALGPQPVPVTVAEGVEGLNHADYWLLQIPRPSGLEAHQLLDVRLRLQLQHAQGQRLLHGMVARVEERDGTQWLLELRPRLWRLQRWVGSRSYACSASDRQGVQGGLTVVDLIRQVLARHELGADDVDFSGVDASALDQHLQMVQYQESDWDFLMRWCAHQGLLSWFEQRSDREVWCLADASSQASSMGSLPLRRTGEDWNGDDDIALERVVSARLHWRLQPRLLRLREHDWRHPEQPSLHQAEVDSCGHGEVERFDEAVKGDTQAQQRTQLRAAQLAAEGCELSLRSGCRRLRPFTTLRLEGHPHPRIAAGRWLVLHIHHRWYADAQGSADAPVQRYGAEVTCANAERPWHPPRLPWPRIAGCLPAVVVNEGQVDADGVAVDLDDQGRYLVRQAFAGPQDTGLPSRRVRALGPSSLPTADGRPTGVHLPLTSGSEVALMYRAGDPDRPLIVGSLANRDRPSVVTRSDASGHHLQTPAGHRLDFEEEPGQECLSMADGEGAWFTRYGRRRTAPAPEAGSSDFAGPGSAAPSPPWASSATHAGGIAPDPRNDAAAPRQAEEPFWADHPAWQALASVSGRAFADQTLDDRVFHHVLRRPGATIRGRIEAEQAQLYRKATPSEGEYGYGAPSTTPGPLGASMPKGAVDSVSAQLDKMHQEVRVASGQKGYQQLTGGDVLQVQHGDSYTQRWGDEVTWQHGDDFTIHQHGMAYDYYWNTEKVNWGGGNSYSYDPEPEEMDVVGLARIASSTQVAKYDFSYVEKRTTVELGGVAASQEVAAVSMDLQMQGRSITTIDFPTGKTWSKRLAMEVEFFLEPVIELNAPSRIEAGGRDASLHQWKVKTYVITANTSAVSTEKTVGEVGVPGGVAETASAGKVLQAASLRVEKALASLVSVANSVNANGVRVE